MFEFDCNGNKVEIEIVSVTKQDIEKIISEFPLHQNYRLTYKAKKHCLCCNYKGDIDGYICPNCRAMNVSDTETELCAKTNDTRIKNGGLVYFAFDYGTMQRQELSNIVEISIIGKVYVISE